MTVSKKILALDFDGVLCNSIHDSVVTALNTYLKCTAKHHLPLQEPLTPENVTDFENKNPEFMKKFTHLMPLGNFAKDYYVILKIIDKNKYDTISSQKDFNDFRESLDDQQMETYNNLFYEYRHTLQKNNPEAWAALLPAFPDIPQAVRKLSKTFLPAVATSKDVNSVNILLEKYGIDDLFSSENILDKDFARTKREHMIKFKQLHHLDFADIHFIDDKISHLLEVKDLKVHTYLAAWGFNTEREHKTAGEHGINLLALKDFPHLTP
ncbi:MAG: hypothetical protein R6V04_00710 [bacterium]